MYRVLTQRGLTLVATEPAARGKWMTLGDGLDATMWWWGWAQLWTLTESEAKSVDVQNILADIQSFDPTYYATNQINQTARAAIQLLHHLNILKAAWGWLPVIQQRQPYSTKCSDFFQSLCCLTPPTLSCTTWIMCRLLSIGAKNSIVEIEVLHQIQVVQWCTVAPNARSASTHQSAALMRQPPLVWWDRENRCRGAILIQPFIQLLIFVSVHIIIMLSL